MTDATATAPPKTEESTGQGTALARISRVGDDPIGQAVRSLFGYAEERSEDETKRLSKQKLGQTERKKVEIMIVERVKALAQFVTRKVKPRIEMFVENLGKGESGEIQKRETKLVEVDRKLETIQVQQADEMEAAKRVIEEKFRKRRQALEDEQHRLKEEVKGITAERQGRIRKLQGRLESKLDGFDQFVGQMKTTAVEMLWTNCTNMLQANDLLNKVPSSDGFMTVIGDMAVASGDRVLQVLLAGEVTERNDWYCERCQKFTTLTEESHPGGGDYKILGRRDSDGSENAGKIVCVCGECGITYLKEHLSSMRSPFCMKVHEVISINTEDAKGTDIMEFVQGDGVGDENQKVKLKSLITVEPGDNGDSHAKGAGTPAFEVIDVDPQGEDEDDDA